MKPRHAARSGLWAGICYCQFLIRNGKRIDNIHDVPMSRWERESFDTDKAECEATEARFQALAERSKTWPKLPHVDYAPRYAR